MIQGKRASYAVLGYNCISEPKIETYTGELLRTTYNYEKLPGFAHENKDLP